MSKLKWGVGAIIALSATAVGGHLYTAQSLKSFYQQDVIPQSEKFSVQYQNFEMGLLRGQADWHAQLRLDPCKPNEVIRFQGQDQIHRSWDGYRIHSQIKLIQAEPSVQKLFEVPLQADTRITWTGQTQTTLTTPAISQKLNNLQITLDPMRLTIQGKPKEQEFKLLKLQLEMPNLTVTDQTSYLQLSGLKFATDQGLNQQLLEAGKTEMRLERMKVMGTGLRKSRQAELRNLHFKTQTELTERGVNTQMAFGLQEMSFPGTSGIRDVKFNFDLNQVHQGKLLEVLQVLKNAEQNCVPANALLKQLEPALVGMMNEGFAFASKDNQMKVEQGFAKATINGRVMPGHQANFENLWKMMPRLLEYNAELQFDKNLVAALMKGVLGQGKGSSDQEIENMLTKMQESGQLKREGDVMKMAVEYKYGEKKFLTE